MIITAVPPDYRAGARSRYPRRLPRARCLTGRSTTSTPGSCSSARPSRTSRYIHERPPRFWLCHFFYKIIASVVALLTVCPHQRDATSSTIADDLEIKCRELEDLDRNLQRLRSEQDRAAAAGESALRLRLKREELFSAEVRPRDFKSLTSPSTHTRSRITRCNSITSSLTRCTSIVSSLTRAVEHARTFAGAPRSVTRRKETRVARDFW